ncbi:hypothetical protein Deipe_2707 [Deinococcus peraridilitoris DSM 19664]|uniref:Uncharacterized protein n=1 Tax=Deinococcus peraridilitoris (strain DSM 19664 / LMG 22246 / CIP 109416 / KR-200) TaxID=937777 RepID=L0A4S9_DEIPD|nr:hypothetical protein Deipe_2707 [Deinococcus peraridilitoris DSM 19664]
MKLLSRADVLLAGRPELMQALRNDPAVFIASPLNGLRPQQKRKVRAVAKKIHAVLRTQPPLLPL